LIDLLLNIRNKFTEVLRVQDFLMAACVRHVEKTITQVLKSRFCLEDSICEVLIFEPHGFLPASFRKIVI
jgi:hypothetical protein